MRKNRKQFPWPSGYYKNTSYNYPWYTHLLSGTKLANHIIKGWAEA